MGRPKLLLPWHGTSILGHLLAQWRELGVEQLAIVRAADDPLLLAESDRLGFPREQVIDNHAPELGMFHSIRTAARWTGWMPSLNHWALVLGDQPHLQPATLRRLLKHSAAHPAQVCQPSRGGHARHPVVLPAEVFQRIPESPANDLKEFLATYPQAVACCESDDPGLDLDLDRPEDYLKALEIASVA